MTIGANDFLATPMLQNVITDTHFDNPNRKGRFTAFLARIAADEGIRSFGIAANEYVAICIDGDGKARVFGDYPNYDEFAFFAQANCQENFEPETCLPGNPLHWNRSGEALKIYKVPGTMNGTNYFQLSDWQTGSGGSWQNWSVINGALTENPGLAPDCVLRVADFAFDAIRVFPVPFATEIHFEGIDIGTITFTDIKGKIVFSKAVTKSETINTTAFAAGIYVVTIESEGKRVSRKIIKN